MTTFVLPPSLAYDDVHVRKAAVSVEKVTEEGLVKVRLAPYEHEIELTDGLREVFTRGCFAAATGNPSRVKVTNQGHDRGVIIGHAVELEDKADAIYGTLKIADTTHGRDVLTLFRSGSLSELSVEFRPQKKYWQQIQQRDGNTLWRHDRATLVGVSPVGHGAYAEEARVLAVREAARISAAEEAIRRLSSLTSGPRRG